MEKRHLGTIGRGLISLAVGLGGLAIIKAHPSPVYNPLEFKTGDYALVDVNHDGNVDEVRIPSKNPTLPDHLIYVAEDMKDSIPGNVFRTWLPSYRPLPNELRESSSRALVGDTVGFQSTLNEYAQRDRPKQAGEK